MAYYCFHRFGWPPSRTADMSKREKAFVMACIEMEGEMAH